MFDRDPGRIIRRLARRDEEVTTDAFHVAFDSYFDHRTAFRFSVSVAGVQSDWLLFSDTAEDPEWDAVWESATRTDESGWTAELRIPLSQLRFARSGEDGGASTWGINFWRQIARLEESSVWSPLPDDGSRIVSAFGTLRDLEGIEPRRNVELRPYVLSSATRAPGTEDDPFYAATALHQTVGGDLKYGITDNLTLNLTLNPDFGQVEADPSVVNLTAFETFFPEKRPFFQEGADIFDLAVGAPDDENNESLFYSRRIGRSPQGSVTSPSEYRDVPDATRILGAAKLSGKTADGWSIGFLNALTSNEMGRFSTRTGTLGEQLVEPVTNYAVGRVIRDFRDGESAIGLIATATNRRVDAGGPVAFLADAAYTGGVDFRHRFGGGNYEVNGHLIASAVMGSAGAIERIQRSSVHFFQRPDADHVGLDPSRTSLAGTVARLSFSKVGGGNWRYGLFSESRSPRLRDQRSRIPAEHRLSGRGGLGELRTVSSAGTVPELGGELRRVVGLDLRRRTAVHGRERERELPAQELLARLLRVQSRGVGARDDGAPGRSGPPSTRPVEYLGRDVHGLSQARAAGRGGQPGRGVPDGDVPPGDLPPGDDPALESLSAQPRSSLQPERRRLAVRRPTPLGRGHALRVRAAEPADGLPHDAAELHLHAEPVAAVVRPALRQRRELRPLDGGR